MIAHARPRRPGTGARMARKGAPKPRRKQPATRAASVHHGEGSAAGTPPPRPLTPSQRRYLRGLCHDLKPLILLGNKGVTPQVGLELGRTLEHHELVKVKLSGGDRGERQRQVEALLAASGAELVQQIGHVASLYRRNADRPRLALPA